VGALAILLAYGGTAVRVHGQESTPAAPSTTLPHTTNDHQGPSSAQSNMSKIDTNSGGAPASSPQGDAPPGMQPVPAGPDKTNK
jgi:hypothetical protein